MQKEIAFNIDLTYLHSVTGGDKEFEKILLETALSDMQKQVNELKMAWQGKDAAAVRRAAHTLKSVTAIAGLSGLESCCKTMEHLFADGIFHSEAIDNLDEIVFGWETAKPQLVTLIAEY